MTAAFRSSSPLRALDVYSQSRSPTTTRATPPHSFFVLLLFCWAHLPTFGRCVVGGVGVGDPVPFSPEDFLAESQSESSPQQQQQQLQQQHRQRIFLSQHDPRFPLFLDFLQLSVQTQTQYISAHCAPSLRLYCDKEEFCCSQFPKSWQGNCQRDPCALSNKLGRQYGWQYHTAQTYDVGNEFPKDRGQYQHEAYDPMNFRFQDMWYDGGTGDDGIGKNFNYAFNTRDYQKHIDDWDEPKSDRTFDLGEPIDCPECRHSVQAETCPECQDDDQHPDSSQTLSDFYTHSKNLVYSKPLATPTQYHDHQHGELLHKWLVPYEGAAGINTAPAE
eukprot:gnl/Spiro4/16841_TR9067_c1_g1_i1.p1 gnl/Spiro4/16841_TR9067_c1_g1~~gnl/Spiro4/16841_TR9067_c1_g1_i1.p1  ORF type:complete len:331 (-),score=59.56 gnl/Spiro4/16841_TR9067_c1_g1_i1:76-1068(-)